MKVTVEIPEDLYWRANKYAADQGITFSEIVETGLRRVLEHKQAPKPFRLRKASFGGDGLQPGVTWHRLRELSYGGPAVLCWPL